MRVPACSVLFTCIFKILNFFFLLLLLFFVQEQQPTIIFPTKQQLIGIPNLTRAIQRTGLYERVAIISNNPNVYYKSIIGDIYRLKSFKQ